MHDELTCRLVVAPPGALFTHLASMRAAIDRRKAGRIVQDDTYPAMRVDLGNGRISS
jgi:hypothetical protein